MNSKLIGGILLIIGTSIGGGMLALPLAEGSIGFLGSSLLLLLCWLIMTLGAFAILEVNSWLPSGSNLISMAKITLGIPGKITAWFVYLFLLYALLSAYISGGSDVFQSILTHIGINVSDELSALLFVLIFGTIVYSGVHVVDFTNRGLMFGKLGICVLLLLLIFPQMSLEHLLKGNWHYLGSAIMIGITSFGFATIVPSLRTYFDDDIPKLRKAIWIGSLIPLVIYIAWDAAIMGIIPINGEHGLLSLSHSEHSTSDLTSSLIHLTQSHWIAYFFQFFTSVCMLTAFLGVSLGLFDFLADGLNIKKQGRSGLLIVLIAYLPPLLIVLFYPGAFISALSYAGVFCVILLLLMPVLMLWSGKYIKKIAKTSTSSKMDIVVLMVLILISIFLIYLAIPQ